MALTRFQREVCRELAARRVASGESYFAGGATLNELVGASRLSRDIDLFHDTEQAVASSFEADRAALEALGIEVVLTATGELCRLLPDELDEALARGMLRFHAGRIGGALPVLRPA